MKRSIDFIEQQISSLENIIIDEKGMLMKLDAKLDAKLDNNMEKNKSWAQQGMEEAATLLDLTNVTSAVLG